jgi:hypothetical protein
VLHYFCPHGAGKKQVIIGRFDAENSQGRQTILAVNLKLASLIQP